MFQHSLTTSFYHIGISPLDCKACQRNEWKTVRKTDLSTVSKKCRRGKNAIVRAPVNRVSSARFVVMNHVIISREKLGELVLFLFYFPSVEIVSKFSIMKLFVFLLFDKCKWIITCFFQCDAKETRRLASPTKRQFGHFKNKSYLFIFIYFLFFFLQIILNSEL